MPILRITTRIRAPIERCFDLARDVDAHVGSLSHTRERAVAGVTTGLLELGDRVTWEAVHFGIRLRLTVAITEFDRPHRFVDERTDGALPRLRHVHEFRTEGDETVMTDVFDYSLPMGMPGRVIDRLCLERYLRRLLARRCAALKRMAEEAGTSR